MGVTGPLILLLLAVWTPALALRREFHFFNVLKTWSEAQTHCRDNLLELASIRDTDEWERAKEVLLIAGNQSTWVGLYDDEDSWRWTIDNSSFREEGRAAPETYLTFSFGNNGLAHCGVWMNSKLIGGGCSGMGKSICYDETSDSYIQVASRPTWEQTLDFCRSTYTDLAMIRTPQEHQKLRSSFPAYTFWIGLHREGWKWSDQSDASFREWLPGAPSGYHKACGFAVVDGWSNTDCNLQLPVLCAGPPRQMLKVVMRTKGALDLNDPLVHGAILSQMEEQLRNNGVHEDFRLSWVQQPHGDFFNKTLP